MWITCEGTHCIDQWHSVPIGSMYAIYGNIYHQYTPFMLAYIPAPWILWDIELDDFSWFAQIADGPDSGQFFPRASERRVLPIVGVCISSSYLHTFSHTFSFSHLLIFTSAHLQIFSHICSSSDLLSHLLIFISSSHIFSHTCSSSHLLIFTSAHLHICSSSHLLSHLLIFTSAHLHIFSHICSSSHLLIFTSAHLHTFSHIFSSSHPLSFLSPFSLSRLLYLSLFRPKVVPAGSHETCTLTFRTKWVSIVKNWRKIAILLVPEQPFRTKWGSIVKNWGKNCDFTCAGATLSHEMRVDRQKLRKKMRFYLCRSNPFARNEGRSSKTEEKLRFYLCRSNPFARNEGRSSKTEVKLRFYLSWSNPFARNEGRCAKTEVKLRFYLCRTCLCVTASVCKSVWV